MKKSTLSLAIGVVGVFGAMILWTFDTNGDPIFLQFFAGLAVLGGVTYVLARLGERR